MRLGKGIGLQGFSPDKKMLLYGFDPESVWRHSVVATYVVINLKNKRVSHNYHFAIIVIILKILQYNVFSLK